jgi:hypothetical protein
MDDMLSLVYLHFCSYGPLRTVILDMYLAFAL